jgi:hypothetical protein
MENKAFQKESDRMNIAAAAISVAGSQGDNFILGEVLPEGRRRYLYAIPADANPEGRFTTSNLSRSLRGEDVPYAVNWDRSHERQGLRYLPDYVRVPESLKGFTGKDARVQWSAWKKHEGQISAVVANLAQEVTANPEINLGEGQQDRIASAASRLADRTKPVLRKQRDEERS